MGAAAAAGITTPPERAGQYSAPPMMGTPTNDPAAPGAHPQARGAGTAFFAGDAAGAEIVLFEGDAAGT